MKETVPSEAPKVIKQLQFSLLNAQDTVKISEFQVTHRDLYTPTDRLPVKDGVLDRRLVSCPHLPIHNALISISGNDREECILRDLRPQFCGLRWPLCIYQTGGPSIPHRLLQAYHCHPSGHMQNLRPRATGGTRPADVPQTFSQTRSRKYPSAGVMQTG